MTTEVVLLAGSGAQPTSSGGELRELLTQRLGECRISVIAPPESAREFPADSRAEVLLGATRTDVLLARTGITALDRFLGRSAPGRLLSSLGPLTAGRVLRRAIRHDPRALEVLRGADVVIALDAAGVLAAWEAARRSHRPKAYSGLGPALAVLGR